MRILILGPSGQIGYELAANAGTVGEVITAGRSAADITIDPLNKTELSNLFSSIKPDIVINAIAYTAVDKAETDQDMAFSLNADLPAALADLCEQSNTLLIHYSTDFVFDGCNDKPYMEDDATQPLSIYGRSKLAGEKALQTASCPSVILRTSWVYGERGSNFLLTMIRLGKERESLSVVNDQVGAPSYCRDIALATIQLCNLYKNDPDKFKSHNKIYHLTCGGETSWFDFAKAIFEQVSDKESLALNELSAITSDQYPVAATRPTYSVLDCSKINEDLGIVMPDWKESLKACLKRYYD